MYVIQILLHVHDNDMHMSGKYFLTQGCVTMYGKPSDANEIMKDEKKEDLGEDFTMRDDLFEADTSPAHC